jgi:two-component system NtrC family sensor kinase
MWDSSREVRPGLRLQILLLVGGLVVAAFLPLFFAVSTYARYTLGTVRASSARALGRAIAGQVAEARSHRPPQELSALLEAHVGETGVLALALVEPDGSRSLEVGERAALHAVQVTPGKEALHSIQTAHGRALAVVVPDARGAVVAVLRVDDESAQVAPLIRLSGLYMGLVALALLILTYFALTRLIVRPLDQLSRAAERVAGGSRRFEVPRTAARELYDLGASVRTMAERLLAEEEALRGKIDEVERATAQLKEAQASLVRSERLASVGRLAAGLAHEVGNPIAAILGMQDLLLEGGLEPEEQRDFIERMHRETERINRILRDLLDFARPAATSLPKAGEPGNVEAAIFDTVALLSPQTSMKDVDLAVDVHSDLPPVVLSREHLVQILLNLILNAADACSGKGRVTARAERSELGVRLSVEDDGPGVSPIIRDRLFEPFATTKDIGKGTGLGLAVCRGLVEAVGGTIALDAAYTAGARFVVDLPVAA